MKNKIFMFFFAGILLSGATSCKDQLDIDPTASLSPEIVGAAEASKLLVGVYDGLQTGSSSADYYYLSFATQDLSADNLVYRATFFQHGEVDNNAILTNNVLVSRYFNHPYVAIQRANDLIGILEASSDIPNEVKNPILGEAHFLRAYAYYRLVTLFGPVPLVLDRDIKKIPRSSEAEVYAQIIQDAEFALTNAPAFVAGGDDYATSEAAKALLARVYLILDDMPNAKKYADEVISSGKFAIETNYANAFTKPFVSSEHIFKLKFTATEGDSYLPFFLQHPDMPGSGRAELPVDQSLVDAYEPGDTRKDASIQYMSAAPAGWYAKKYQDPAGDDAVPMYIFRISEMYLISAEAQFRISQSATDSFVLGRINDVRTKRGLGAKSSVTLLDIINERRVELAFEGTRWTDMRRTPSPSNPSKSIATVFLEAKGRSKNDELYPIPQSAISTNDLLLPNNPGY